MTEPLVPEVPAPGQEPYTDDQEEEKTCTRHALGKALVAGFQLRIYYGKEFDFLQKDAVKALKELDQMNDNDKPMWPQDFNDKNISLIEQTTKQLLGIKVFVKQVEKREFVDRNGKTRTMYSIFSAHNYFLKYLALRLTV